MDSSSSSGLPPPPKFNGEQYHVWSALMRNHLMALDLWELVASDKEKEKVKIEGDKPVGASSKSQADKMRALVIIQRSVSDSIIHKLMNCTSPRQAWELLRDQYAGTERTKSQILINLRREFENMKMKKGEPIRTYADRIDQIVSKIRIYGDDSFTEKRVVEKIVNTLPRMYEFTISSFENSGREINKVPLGDLVNALHALEQRMANRDDDDERELAMYAKSKVKTKQKKPEPEKRKQSEKVLLAKKVKEKSILHVCIVKKILICRSIVGGGPMQFVKAVDRKAM